MKKATLGKNGRIVIPKSYRDEMNIEEGSPLIITFEKGNVIVSQDKSNCALCGALLKSNRALRLCDKCVSEVVRSRSSK